MPPSVPEEMTERSQAFDVDIEKQTAGDKSDESTRGVPTFTLTAPNEKGGRNKTFAAKDMGNVLPLPSSQYRYTKWHDIQHMEVKGSMLRSPRIRRAPKGYHVSTIHEMEKQDEDDHDSVPSRQRWKNRKRLHFQSKLESWETCEAVNLSFQELGHPYQLKHFLAVLQKLIRCENLQLMDNGLTDLSGIYLPRCRHLYLQRNFLSNLKKLPRAPVLEHLSLQQNNIESLDGISNLRKTKISSLTLRNNPIELDPNYRQKIFKLIPNLKMLDDIPKLQEDSAEVVESGTCCIS